jgi:alpha-D-xyloside xylohydrolase
MPPIRFCHYPDYFAANGPLGYERIPRQPQEGLPVTLLAAVEGCESLTLRASADGKSRPDMDGKFVREANGRRFYSFDMGHFPYGCRVAYSFEAYGETSREYGFDVCRETDIAEFSCIDAEDGAIRLETGHPLMERLYLAFENGRLVISGKGRAGQGALAYNGDIYVYTATACGCRAEVNPEKAAIDIFGADGGPVMRNLTLRLTHSPERLLGFAFRYETGCGAVYGLGERFGSVNHIGRKLNCAVEDRFTEQGKATYFPVPFYYGGGHGVFVDTHCVSEYDFGSAEAGIFAFGARAGTSGKLPDTHVFFGEPAEILRDFTALSGRPELPPEWAFGLWVSANRWDRQSIVEEQLDIIRRTEYPADVLVLEAWSDEATFYIWNDAQYEVKHVGEGFAKEDFHYPADGRWPDPQGMIGRLHGMGMKLVLWQIPVLKQLGAHELPNAQLEADIIYAEGNGLCAAGDDGKSYRTPDFWFAGSRLPDFTRREARGWWFARRGYLLDMGVNGFKTDGGEFVHEDGCRFSDGSTGVEMRNGFAASYLDAYAAFIGKGRALFSRAGHTGSQRHPFHWAGDQKSTWEELRAVLRAGLSLGMSGQPFWSFDIGGFAGPLPTAELYIRATELAAFAPAMQWHSEPSGGQFGDGAGVTVNDRSPWNIARATGDPNVMPLSLFWARLHANLRPQFLSEARKSTLTGLPMMRHLALEYPGDPHAATTHDQFMLGNIMVAPVVDEGARERDVYLPSGGWMDLWTGEDVEGGRTIRVCAPLGRIPLYLRHGGTLALELGPSMMPGAPVEKGKSICVFVLAGDEGKEHFYDSLDKDVSICWKGDSVTSTLQERKPILLRNCKFGCSIVSKTI